MTEYLVKLKSKGDTIVQFAVFDEHVARSLIAASAEGSLGCTVDREVRSYEAMTNHGWKP